MRTVLLRVDGPRQAWGVRSRFELRDGGTEPSKSGMIGLIANALGVSPEDDEWVQRLARCQMGVRVDREGQTAVDFHTVGGGGDEDRRVHGTDTAILTQREYICDADFLVALGYDDESLANEIDAALEDPRGLLFLGRKCCPPSPHLRQGVVNTNPEAALRSAPWRSTEPPAGPVRLVLECDYGQGEPREDQPISFRSHARRYRRRWVLEKQVTLDGALVPDDVRAPAGVTPLEVTKSAPLEVMKPAAKTATRPARAVTSTSVAGRDRGFIHHVSASTRPYLTRIFLNPQSHDVARDLRDVHALHRRVMSAFPDREGDDVRAQHGALHRLDFDARAGRAVLLVQSMTEPDWRGLPTGYALDLLGAVDNPAVTTVSLALLAVGDVLDFQLRANPAKNSGAGGKVQPAVWIEEMAARSGFRLRGLQIVDEPDAFGLRPNSNARPDRLTFSSAFFSGRLLVQDPYVLRQSIVHGIGRGKAFGFGLLTFTRV